MKLLSISKTVFLAAITSFFLSNNALASLIGYADTVVEYFDGGNGSLTCPEGQGGVWNANLNTSTSSQVCQPLSVVLGDDADPTSIDYLSLSQNSFITVGFTDDVIIDGIGNDIFISEVGSAQELANIYVSSTLSINPSDFVFLGQANGNTVSSFDLANIGFTDQVRAVKILSLNNGGYPTAPGFDLAHVRAINFEPAPAPMPIPVPLALIGLGLVGIGFNQRKV